MIDVSFAIALLVSVAKSRETDNPVLTAKVFDVCQVCIHGCFPCVGRPRGGHRREFCSGRVVLLDEQAVLDASAVVLCTPVGRFVSDDGVGRLASLAERTLQPPRRSDLVDDSIGYERGLVVAVF